MLRQWIDQRAGADPKRYYWVTVGGGVALLLFSGWVWWHFTYLNPENVFWGALQNNLQLSGVTKQVSSEENAKIEEYAQISLGSVNAVKSVASVTQNDNFKVVTETVGTPNANYTRYTQIKTPQKKKDGQPLDFSKVVNRWGKLELGGQASSKFSEVLYSGIPVSRLNKQAAQAVLKTMKTEVYQVDFAKVGKKRQQGRLEYEYKVKIAPASYVAMLKQLDALNNLKQMQQLDPAQYQGSEQIEITVVINAQGRQISRVTYDASGRQENYRAYGARPSWTVPETNLASRDLEQEVNQAFSEATTAQ